MNNDKAAGTGVHSSRAHLYPGMLDVHNRTTAVTHNVDAGVVALFDRAILNCYPRANARIETYVDAMSSEPEDVAIANVHPGCAEHPDAINSRAGSLISSVDGDVAQRDNVCRQCVDDNAVCAGCQD